MMSFDSQMASYTKCLSQWVVDLDIKSKTETSRIKPTRKPFDFGLRKQFLGKTERAQTMREKKKIFETDC